MSNDTYKQPCADIDSPLTRWPVWNDSRSNASTYVCTSVYMILKQRLTLTKCYLRMDRVCPNHDKNLESLIAIHCFPIFEMVAFRLFTFIGRNCRTILVVASTGLHFEPNSMCTKVDYEWTAEKNEWGNFFVLLEIAWSLEMNFSRYLKLIVSSSVSRNVNLKSYFIRISYIDWFSRKKVLKHYLKSVCWVEDWIPTDILRNVVTYFSLCVHLVYER